MAADLLEIVALRVEEQPVEKRLRRVGVRRIPRTHEVVETLERLLGVRGGILVEGLDDHVLLEVPFLHDENDLRDLRHLHLLDVRLGDRLSRLEDHLSRLAAHDVLGDVAPDEPAVLLARPPGEIDDLGPVEQLDDGAVGLESHRLEKHRDRYLPPAIDVHVHDVVHVDREFDPRSAVRNDAGVEEALAVRMEVVVEDDARRTVELAHDHPLGAVDDERPHVGDQGNLAEVHLALDDVLDNLLAVLVLAHDEPERRLEGSREREVALLAFLDAVLRLADGVTEILERELSARRNHRKNGVEHRFETDDLPLIHRDVALKKSLV